MILLAVGVLLIILILFLMNNGAANKLAINIILAIALILVLIGAFGASAGIHVGAGR